MHLHFLSNFIPLSTQSSAPSTARALSQPKRLKEKQSVPAQPIAKTAVNVYWANVLNAPQCINEQETLEATRSQTQMTRISKLRWWM